MRLHTAIEGDALDAERLQPFDQFVVVLCLAERRVADDDLVVDEPDRHIRLVGQELRDGFGERVETSADDGVARRVKLRSANGGGKPAYTLFGEAQTLWFHYLSFTAGP